MLVFAVYRNFKLCEKVRSDVCALRKPEIVDYLNKLKSLFAGCSIFDMSWTAEYLSQMQDWLAKPDAENILGDFRDA